MTLESTELCALQTQILDQVHDSIIVMNLTGRIVKWNNGAVRLHGYSAEEAIGHNISLICESKNLKVFDPGRLSRLCASGFHEYEATARTKSGQVHQLYVRLSLIRDASNEPVGVLALATDITELVKARMDLQDRERQMRAILDALPMLIAYIDPQLRFRFANKAYEAWFNCPSSDVVGRSVIDVVGSNFHGMLPHISTALRGSKVTVEQEFTFPMGERRWLLSERIPDADVDGTVRGYFVVETDVTESKRIQAARIEEERRLRETLIAEVHHRVKNGLQGIVGLLRVQVGKNPDLANALAPVIAQVLSISVGFGLMSTRGANGIVLCDMVREIGRNLEQITGASISTEFDQTILDRPIVVDRRHAVNLGMVVNELIFNAVRHGKAPATGPRVIISMNRTRELATVRISSHIGSQPIAFDYHSGTGLGTGLALVRALLPSRGSELSFVSDADQLTAILKLNIGEFAPTPVGD